ncbi:hypothetical protein LTS15_002184 [Exophiala xenobiotica]|nr:hypothetical protein LTS15_002184 [Exophiala xenobiotica]
MSVSGVSTKPKISDSVMEMFSMKGRVASVTGAGAGIGFAVAEGLAEAGADVAIWYNSNDKALQRAEDIAKRYGVRCKAYKCQITDAEAVSATIEQIVADFGRIDAQIVNHGIPARGGLLESSIEDWHRVIDTDFHGAMYVARATGYVFQRQGSGSMVFTTSMSGHIVNTPRMQSSYNAAKAGLIHLAKSLAIEWKDFARVNCVSPGYIDTEIASWVAKEQKAIWHQLTPMGREGDPRELKGIYLYLASDASTFTTGADFIVDGGYTVL